MAQLVEHILGKDEVPSSNLGSSSRKTPIVRSGLLVFIELRAATQDENCVSLHRNEVQCAYPDRVGRRAPMQNAKSIYNKEEVTIVGIGGLGYLKINP